MGKSGTKLIGSALIGCLLLLPTHASAQQYNLRSFGTDDGLPPQVAAIGGDSLGYLWIDTRGGRYRYDGFRFVPFPASTGPSLPIAGQPLPPALRDSLRGWNFPALDGRPTAYLRTRNGRTWVGTERRGAWVYLPRSRQWLRLDEATGLGRNHVTALYEDRWGYVWIGTRGGGLSRYAGRQFVQYSRAEGLRSRRVYALTRSGGGGLWLALGRAGIARYRNGRFEHYGPAEGYPTRDARTLLTDRTDALWIGTAGDGLYLFDSLGFHRIGPVDSLDELRVRALRQDRLGTTWLATDRGALQLGRPDSSYRVALKTYLPGRAINTLHLDRRARVWLGTARGLVVSDKGEAQPVAVPGTVPVTGIAETADGVLYVGTSTGIWSAPLYDRPSDWVRLTGELPARPATLAADSLGRLWLGAETGLYRLHPSPDRRTARVQRYTGADGFRGGEVLAGAVLPEAAGALWLGTTNGLTYYRPGTDRRNTVAPVVDLREIRLFYEALDQTRYAPWYTPGGLRAGLELAPTDNHLGFTFFAPNLPAPEGLRYQWRLVGAEPTWSPLTERRDAMYPNLPPGDYTFLVRACNEDQLCGEAVRVPFSIRAPWWQHWYVVAAGLLLVLLLVWGIFHLRLRQIRRRAARAQQRLALENQLLALEQKAQRLRMNPHFIFNALHTVQGLIAQNEPALARRQLSRFAKLMRRVLEHSIHDKISLADEIDTLQHYLAVEHTSRGGSFTYRIDTELQEAPETLELPPMLVQPFVENALQHGLRGKRDGEVRIAFVQREEELLITVTDNGIGRAAAARRPTKADQSRAVTITLERLRLLSQSAADVLTTEDLYAASGSPAGTRVTLRVPLNDV